SRTAAALALLVLAAPAFAAPAPTVKLTKIEVHPASFSIDTPFAYSQVLLTGVTYKGDRIDVTGTAKYTAPAAVTVSATGLVRPKAAGKGTLTATVEGLKVEIPVTVANLKKPHEASFVRDVMPVLARLGCNAGTCHGAQAGRNGFKLSLRGY